MLKKTLIECSDFYIFSNWHIAMIAVGSTYITHILFIQCTDYQYLGFIFCSTLAAYSLHWALTDTAVALQDSRALWTQNYRYFLSVQCAFASVVAAYYCWQYFAYWQYILPAVALTFLYTAPKIPYPPFLFLRGMAFAKTFYLAVVWVYVTVVLPLAVSPHVATIINAKIALFSVNRWLLIYPICILFDYRDKDIDYQNNIKNIYFSMSQNSIKNIIALFFALFQISNFLLQYNDLCLVEIFALNAPFFALIFSLNNALRSRSDRFFYAYLDGLIAAPIIFFIAKKYLSFLF